MQINRERASKINWTLKYSWPVQKCGKAELWTDGGLSSRTTQKWAEHYSPVPRLLLPISWLAATNTGPCTTTECPDFPNFQRCTPTISGLSLWKWGSQGFCLKRNSPSSLPETCPIDCLGCISGSRKSQACIPWICRAQYCARIPRAHKTGPLELRKHLPGAAGQSKLFQDAHILLP